MTRIGFMISTTSERALSAAEGRCLTKEDQVAPISDFSGLDAVESRSILGHHDGTMPDELMELLESAPA